jgi:hypothetical protein
MNLYGIRLDKIIVLNDKSEEIPGNILNNRPGFSELYNAEQEI